MRTHDIVVLAVLSSGMTAWCDVTVKATYKSGGETTNYKAYAGKQRQRFEYGPGVTIIRQSDKQRVIEIDDESKSWVAIPQDHSKASVERKGGVVTVTSTIVDLGETKTMLGFSARHLKTTVVTVAGSGACHPGSDTVETDGWFVDVEFPDPLAETTVQGCRDEIRYVNNGAVKRGYPVAFTSRIIREKGEEATTIQGEVIELSTAAIPDSIFEPPAGYTERKSAGELVAARPKPTGVVRVGVTAFGDSSGQQLPVAPLNARLAAMLGGQGVQAIPLAAARDAEAAQCDWVLTTEVTGVAKSAVGQVAGKVLKFGGMLSRGAAKAPAQDGTEATLQFALTRIGQSEPALSSSATGKNGRPLNIKTALEIASFVSPMGMMMHSAGGGMFGMFGAQWMRGPGGGVPDPALAMMLGGLGQTAQPAEPASSEMSAVSAALEKEAQAVKSKVGGGA